MSRLRGVSVAFGNTYFTYFTLRKAPGAIEKASLEQTASVCLCSHSAVARL